MPQKYAHPVRRFAGVVVAAAAVAAVGLTARPHRPAAPQIPAPPAGGLAMIPGIAVGHVTLAARPTGCTVVLAPEGSVGAVDVRGGSPGTRETDLLAPDNAVQHVHAIVFAGGSAFGLDAASGVMRFLAEKKIGFETSAGPVPIVPAAILFDLNVGGRPDVRPDAACGYEAARRATTERIEEGSVGAGAGATVGKLLGPARAMKGGVGTAGARLPDGVLVAALVVVNAVGTVVDPRTGRAIAGVRTADGRALEDPFALVRRGDALSGPGREHTTIGVVATTARLTKAQAHTVAKMAQDGVARAIVPSHTSQDGDTLFALATGAVARDVNVSALGALAADVVAEAIGRAVTTARGLPGFPSVSDLRAP